MLALEVDFLRGVSVGCFAPGDTKPEFPPHSDRLFSALVASWGARGRCEDEKVALEWLESLEPPRLYASAHRVRTAPTVYVPTNDPAAAEVLPNCRVRHQRRFAAAIPDASVVTYQWRDASPSPRVFDSLQVLAHCTPYVGHSSSVVRCYFHCQAEAEVRMPEVFTQRRIYGGRLAELERDYRLERRTPRGPTIRTRRAILECPRSNLRGRYWHVFADAGGYCPDLRRIAVTARAFRSLLLSAYGGCEAPEAISGHVAGTHAVSSRPHLAILPMADVGWRWSDGHLMGVALCLPEEAAHAETEIFQALALVSARQHPGSRHHNECREFSIGLPQHRFWQVVRQPLAVDESLKPQRYLRAARTWATVTPIVLDQPLRAAGNAMRQAEMAQLIARSCTHLGLPSPIGVVPAYASAVRGCPPARRARSEPWWQDWAGPAVSYRELTHAVIQFDQPVEGPVVLGAGRYVGLGLCLPLDAASNS